MIRVIKHYFLFVGLCQMLLFLQARAGVLPSPAPFAGERSKVIVVKDPESVVAFNPQEAKIGEMVSQGLLQLTSRSSIKDAWHSLVSTQEVIGIKVYSAPGSYSGTRPAVVASLVQTLLAAGYPSQNIIIWDRRLVDLKLSGYASLASRLGVGIAGSLDEGLDEKVFYEMALIGKLVWGDHQFGKVGEGVGRKSFVSKLLTQKITKIINVTPMLNHNLAGVCGNLYSLAFGSIDNTIRFEINPERMATAIPEIYAMPELSDRVVLNIVDGLICQYQGEEKTRLHYSSMLGQIRFSTDPVALDLLSIQELNKQRELAKLPVSANGFQIYTNAALLELGKSELRKIEVIEVP